MPIEKEGKTKKEADFPAPRSALPELRVQKWTKLRTRVIKPYENTHTKYGVIVWRQDSARVTDRQKNGKHRETYGNCNKSRKILKIRIIIPMNPLYRSDVALTYPNKDQLKIEGTRAIFHGYPVLEGTKK